MEKMADAGNGIWLNIDHIISVERIVCSEHSVCLRVTMLDKNEFHVASEYGEFFKSFTKEEGL